MATIKQFQFSFQTMLYLITINKIQKPKVSL